MRDIENKLDNAEELGLDAAERRRLRNDREAKISRMKKRKETNINQMLEERLTEVIDVICETVSKDTSEKLVN